jgi:hypothetical protein
MIACAMMFATLIASVIPVPAGGDGMHVMPFEVSTVLVVYVDCSCTPGLTTDSLDCFDLNNCGFGDCLDIDLDAGTPNSPECNAISGCETLVNCQNTGGQITLSLTATCGCTCNNGVNVYSNPGGVFKGTFTSDSSLSFGVGGSAVACTNIDNQEGNGEEFKIQCNNGGGGLDPWCTIKVYDTCAGCGG